MGRIFGTDGVRGIANSQLTPELVFAIGRAQGHWLNRVQNLGHQARVVVGRDTRISGELLQSSYVAGLCSSGATAIVVDVLPTPAIAWLIKQYKADGGGVISASHNPVIDNGLKLVGGDGYKLTDEQEAEISDLAADAGNLPRPVGADVGRIVHCGQEAEDLYVEYLSKVVEARLSPLRIVLDCANGAASWTGPRVFTNLKAELIVINNHPDGININDGCGSTHMEQLKAAVVEHHADMGLAFDGDADRCLAVDERGELVDGDLMLYAFAKWLKQNGQLAADAMVTTVMANLGLEEALQQEGIKMPRTAVGDRYVLAEMRKIGAVIGGEQSGHIIFSQHATTGDGVLSGAMLAKIVQGSGLKLSELGSAVVKKPQLLVNVKVRDKHTWSSQPQVAELVTKIEQRLHGRGRLLVRPSGTESLVRVMAEGPDSKELTEVVEAMRQALEKYCQ